MSFQSKRSQCSSSGYYMTSMMYVAFGDLTILQNVLADLNAIVSILYTKKWNIKEVNMPKVTGLKSFKIKIWHKIYLTQKFIFFHIRMLFLVLYSVLRICNNPTSAVKLPGVSMKVYWICNACIVFWLLFKGQIYLFISKIPNYRQKIDFMSVNPHSSCITI